MPRSEKKRPAKAEPSVSELLRLAADIIEKPEEFKREAKKAGKKQVRRILDELLGEDGE